jgi:small GTP-binding protein
LPTYRRSVVPAKPGAEALPLVAIVGRPNVGKSTLFNRLTRSRRSIVGDEPGITRDRIYGEYEWAGRQFRLVDTGGIVPDDPALIPTEIYNQAKVALEDADALVMVVDVRTELASPDYDLVRILLRGGKPVFLAVNKAEGEVMTTEAENFRRLGIRNVFAISAEHGLGIGDLLDAISEAIPAPAKVELTEDEARAAQEAGQVHLIECIDGDFAGDCVTGRRHDAGRSGRGGGVRRATAAVCGYGGHPTQGQDALDGGKDERGDGAAAPGSRGCGFADSGRQGRGDGKRRHHRRLRPRERAKRDYPGEQMGRGDDGPNRWQAAGGP